MDSLAFLSGAAFNKGKSVKSDAEARPGKKIKKGDGGKAQLKLNRKSHAIKHRTSKNLVRGPTWIGKADSLISLWAGRGQGDNRQSKTKKIPSKTLQASDSLQSMFNKKRSKEKEVKKANAMGGGFDAHKKYKSRRKGPKGQLQETTKKHETSPSSCTRTHQQEYKNEEVDRTNRGGPRKHIFMNNAAPSIDDLSGEASYHADATDLQIRGDSASLESQNESSTSSSSLTDFDVTDKKTRNKLRQSKLAKKKKKPRRREKTAEAVQGPKAVEGETANGKIEEENHAKIENSSGSRTTKSNCSAFITLDTRNIASHASPQEIDEKAQEDRGVSDKRKDKRTRRSSRTRKRQDLLETLQSEKIEEVPPRRSKRKVAPPNRLGSLKATSEGNSSETGTTPKANGFLLNQSMPKQKDTESSLQSSIRPTAKKTPKLGESILKSNLRVSSKKRQVVGEAPAGTTKSRRVSIQEAPLTEDTKEWTTNEIALLRDAHREADPKSSSFWSDVSNRIPSRSMQECQEKWFASVSTPGVQRRKISRQNNKITTHSEADDIFNATPMRFHSSLPDLSVLDSSDIGSAIKVQQDSVVVDSLETCQVLLPNAYGYKTYLKNVKKNMRKAEKSNSGKAPSRNTKVLKNRSLNMKAMAGGIEIKGRLSLSGSVHVDLPDCDIEYEDEEN